MVEENCSSADNSGIGHLTTEENETIERLADISRKKSLYHALFVFIVCRVPQELTFRRILPF
jgi:hypothetical protein